MHHALLPALMALCQAPVDAPAASAPASPALTPIVLDSLFDDWRSLKPVTADPVGDAPTAFVDLGEVRVNVDDNFVHFLVDFGRTVNVQGLDGTAMLVLNADGGDESGVAMHEVLGVDIIIDLSPLSADHPGAPGRGIGLRSTTYTPDSNNPALPPLNPYDIHFAFAPTHAGRRIEFRIGRGVFPKLPPLFLGRGFTGQVIFSDLTGSIQDETEAFTIALPPRPAGASTQPADAGQPTDPLARAPGTQARIMNWNVERSAMIANPDVFVRVFNTLKPDVVLLQELTDKTTLDELRAFASHILPNDPSDGGQWHVMIGQGGGDLRCGIVSRFPLTAVPPLDPMTMISRPDRTVRALGALIDVAGRPLLATSLHLKCCGRLGSSEDQTRLEEVAAVHRALTAACEELKPQALLIAGDFNLVGSRDPLEQLVTALDLDGSPLEIVDAYQIDGRSNATWADRDQPFVPGRLDYALFSDSSLVIRGCFVYDAFDLAPRWCEVHGAQTRDTSSASDHLPVVFDVAWK